MDGDVALRVSETFFKNKGDVSTSTGNGVIAPWWRDFETEADDEWFSYIQVTEYILRPRRRENAIYDDGAGDQRCDVPMRKSMFPFVAPYVLMHSIDCKCPKLSHSISKHLKWRLSGVTPKILSRTLLKSGYRLVSESEEWSGIWGSTLSDSGMFKQLKSFQKFNSFPGSRNLGCKNYLCNNINVMRKRFGIKEFGFFPETYVLPEDIERLKRVWNKNLGANNKWIIKPPSSARGQGIRVIDQWWEVPKWHSAVIQRYLSKPNLINGSKFDLRVYVLVTSMDPLRIYIYKEGLVRFASVRYVDDSLNLNDRFMHLTNTSVNKYSPNYVPNDSVDSCRGHKWSFSTLWTYLEKENVDVKILWRKIKDIVVKTLISAEAAMCSEIKENVTSTYSCYELYGFDILLDEDLKPWLLEVNTLPSLHTDSPLDTAIKAPLIRNVLNLAGYQLPGNMTVFQERQLVKEYRVAHMRQDERMYSASLCSEELRKQREFLKSPERANYILAIVKNLTRDDVRQLIRYEDELTQLGNFEKIFPTCESYEYHAFFRKPRYYNLLFDAWEFQAGTDRRPGIERLKTFCRKKIHLEPVIR